MLHEQQRDIDKLCSLGLLQKWFVVIKLLSDSVQDSVEVDMFSVNVSLFL